MSMGHESRLPYEICLGLVNHAHASGSGCMAAREPTARFAEAPGKRNTVQ